MPIPNPLTAGLDLTEVFSQIDPRWQSAALHSPQHRSDLGPPWGLSRPRKGQTPI